ncbi:PAS domain S-box protein [Halopelagius longus]|uniref:histidine kinase n=1 Tax=Halopelagius longus TaxID=1236180 RepID=A0A1H0ZCC3_9EURY|nr:PAS domain S-box protein [Halopelagius longus]RDI72935.1 PAS domain S-box protein [Halopelagius longus]SDQ25042.1 PAS domain S-box-containing protein [Halopelagius longus]
MSNRAGGTGSAFWGDGDDGGACERYRTLVNAVDDGIYQLDAEGTVVAANDSLAELTGRTREELLGERASVVFGDGGGSAVERELDRLRTTPGERSARLELTARTAEGERVPCDVRMSALESDGTVEGAVGIVRERAGREGRETDEGGIDRKRMVEALEAAREGISLLDADGEFVYVNDAYAETFGYDPEEMVGEHWDELGIEADPERFYGRILPTISEEGQWTGTTTCVRSDGSTFRSQHSLVSTGEGELICLVRDITERRERERRLRRSERRYRTLAEHFPNGFVTLFDDDLEYTLAAGRGFERIPLEPEAVEGSRVGEVWEGAAADALEPLFRGALDGEEGTVEVSYADREWVVHAVPVTGERGDVFAGMTMAQDITERKERERELDETVRELRESETRLQIALEAGEMGMWELDLRTGESPVRSPQHDRLFGYEEPIDDWGFERFLDHVHPDDRERVARTFEEAHETGEWRFECRIVRTDGERRWISADGEFYDDDGGEPVRAVGTVRDVTEQKERERYLRDAKSQLEAAAEAGAVGTWEWYIPDDEFVTNASLARTFGVDPEAAREGVSLDRLLSSIHEADRERVEREIAEAIESCGEYESEYRVRNADGEIRWVVARGHVECDEDGFPAVFPGALTDITERKEAERRIEESERRYRALVENFPNGAVGLFDEEFRYTAVGGQLLDEVGVPKSDRIGRSVYEIYPDELLEDIKPYFRAALDGETNSFEVQFHDRQLFAYTLPVRNADDEVNAGMLVVQDVTERREAERELRESEAKFRMLAENLDEIVWMATEDGEEFVYINPAFEEVWGIDRETLYDEPLSFLDAVHPDDRSRVREGFTALPETDYDEEFRVVRPDGEVRWVHARGARVYDESGEMSRIVGIGEDVTERVERERELERSERRYRTVVENFPNGAVGLVDEEMRYVTIGGNPLTESDLTADDLEGRPVREVLSPVLADHLAPRYQAALDGEANTFEYAHEDGRYTEFRTFPVRDDDGTVFGAMGMSQDITERVEREAELERALDLLGRTEQIADVGGWEIDPETRDVFWTDHIFSLLEVDADEEPPLEEALDMYHEEDRPIVEDAVEEALASGEPFDAEVRLRTAASGEVRWLRLQGVPQTVDGDVVSLRGAAQDVTDRKQRERRLEELIERLEESNERLEQFAYAASHDLQEPLRMVSSYLRLVERRYADELDEDGREFVEFAVDGADRMREMIEGLLQYSRVDSRGNPLEPVELDAVLADVRDDLQVRIEETDAEITAESLPRVEGDGGQLRQVFQNLLDNALEYSGDEPPRVHVSAERDGQRWEISVADEGIGIDPEDADRVFEVFESLHAPDEHSGTGIGLALSERILERHGGDIRVESEPGEGATFTFTLPADGEDGK